MVSSSSSLWDLSPAAELPGHVCVCRGHVDSSCLDPSSPARVSPALPTDAPHLNAVHVFILLLAGHALIGVLHSSVHVQTAFSFKLQSGIIILFHFMLSYGGCFKIKASRALSSELYSVWKSCSTSSWTISFFSVQTLDEQEASADKNKAAVCVFVAAGNVSVCFVCSADEDS